MQYLLLIYTPENRPETQDPQAAQAEMAEYNAFGAQAGASGALKGGEALQPTTTATTVRVRDGQTITTDGPYAETKEALGGYYVFEANDLDEAIDWAAKIPGARYGAIEVRPIWDFSTYDPTAPAGAPETATVPAG